MNNEQGIMNEEGGTSVGTLAFCGLKDRDQDTGFRIPDTGRWNN
jgi:hypothetical protein